MSYIQIVDIGHEGYAISGDGVTLSGELELLAGSFIGAGDRRGRRVAASMPMRRIRPLADRLTARGGLEQALAGRVALHGRGGHGGGPAAGPRAAAAGGRGQGLPG